MAGFAFLAVSVLLTALVRFWIPKKSHGYVPSSPNAKALMQCAAEIAASTSTTWDEVLAKAQGVVRGTFDGNVASGFRRAVNSATSNERPSLAEAILLGFAAKCDTERMAVVDSKIDVQSQIACLKTAKELIRAHSLRGAGLEDDSQMIEWINETEALVERICGPYARSEIQKRKEKYVGAGRDFSDLRSDQIHYFVNQHCAKYLHDLQNRIDITDLTDSFIVAES